MSSNLENGVQAGTTPRLSRNASGTIITLKVSQQIRDVKQHIISITSYCVISGTGQDLH